MGAAKRFLQGRPFRGGMLLLEPLYLNGEEKQGLCDAVMKLTCKLLPLFESGGFFPLSFQLFLHESYTAKRRLVKMAVSRKTRAGVSQFPHSIGK
jgi:hypothetical protein